MSAIIILHRDPEAGLDRTLALCPCGHGLTLAGFTNTCDGCDRDYNSSGQELAPREQWGADTGESVSDILSVDYGDGWDPGHPGGDGFFD